MSAIETSSPWRSSASVAPMTREELLRLDNVVPREDTRPFGVQTRSARSFFISAPRGAARDVKVAPSELVDGALEVISEATVVHGLPVMSGTIERTRPHPKASRSSDAVAVRRPRRSREDEYLPGFLPTGAPLTYHPKVVPVVGREIKRDADGRPFFRSREAEAHLLEGADNRESVFPDSFPLAAVCKVIVREQKTPESPIEVAHATGFLIGRRSLMGAGHAAPDPFSHFFSIEVIPAMWAGHSVFGLGFKSFVRRFHAWIPDGNGSDMMICELFDPLGDQVGFFGAQMYHSEWEDRPVWTMSGYHMDQHGFAGPFASVTQRGIAVRDDDDGTDMEVDGVWKDTIQIESNADEGEGSSGAPLFGFFNGDVRAIGVHAGVEIDTDLTKGLPEVLSCAGGGPGFLAAVAMARKVFG